MRRGTMLGGAVPIKLVLLLIAGVGGAGLALNVRSMGRSPDAVVVAPAAMHSGPDGLMFAAGATVAPGTEVRVLESRTAATGELWLRVRTPGQGEGDESAKWVQAGLVEPVGLSGFFGS